MEVDGLFAKDKSNCLKFAVTIIFGCHFSLGVEDKLLLFYFNHHTGIFFHVGLMLLLGKLGDEGDFEGVYGGLRCFGLLLDEKWLGGVHELLIVNNRN